jgi:predicted RNA-binding Zn ribbon-like protein
MHKEVTQARDLPEELPLPLSSGRAYWYWIGGSPAIDLVNTLRERWRRRVECLVDGDDLVEWLRRAGLVRQDATVVADARQLGAARELREAIDAVLRSEVDGAPAPFDAVAVIDTLLRGAGPRPGLRLRDGSAEFSDSGPDDPVDAALGMLAADAARLLGTPERARLRICAADDCSARFLDRSPAGRRRWCTMSGCGNRAKVRRHRERQVTGS